MPKLPPLLSSKWLDNHIGNLVEKERQKQLENKEKEEGKKEKPDPKDPPKKP